MQAVVLNSVRKQFGRIVAVDNVSLEVAPGELLTLLGPSGCGKTTTMRLIAGLERNDAGEILVAGRLVSSAERGMFVAPEKRGIGMVFQSYAIWPHMTVFQNVAYPLRVRRFPRAQIEQKVRDSLALVGLGELEHRLATQLSGGQQQRVALARAMVFDPALLLLDEPLSNLDAKLRGQMRLELKRLQQQTGITTIYVTHDQTESMALSDRIVVMNAGRIEQVGDPRTLYESPRTQFVADFIGSTNMLTGTVHQVHPGGETCSVSTPSGDLVCNTHDRTLAPGDRVLLLIRPERVRILPDGPVGAPGPDTNQLRARVELHVYFGDHIEYQVRWGDLALSVTDPAGIELEDGGEVVLEVRARHIVLLPAETSGQPAVEARVETPAARVV